MAAAGKPSDDEPIRLTWEGSYTPKTYFEEPVDCGKSGYTVVIADGKIVVTMSDPDSEVGEAFRADIERTIECVFHAQQVQTGKPYEKTKLDSRNRYHPDGRKGVSIQLESQSVICLASSLDFQIRDSNGTITHDSKAARLEHLDRFREQCLRHEDDPVLSRLRTSFHQAVNDPANALVHLYEIRDALSVCFGSEHNAKKKLGFSRGENEKNWSYFGKMANNEPLQEGRHRGQHERVKLRSATEEELTQVQSIARQMIQAYLDHLDSEADSISITS
jgi:hypothetical protein